MKICDKESLKKLLSNAIPLLCKNGLPNHSTFRIDAMIGITIGPSEASTLICFSETISPNKGHHILDYAHNIEPIDYTEKEEEEEENLNYINNDENIEDQNQSLAQENEEIGEYENTYCDNNNDNYIKNHEDDCENNNNFHHFIQQKSDCSPTQPPLQQQLNNNPNKPRRSRKSRPQSNSQILSKTYNSFNTYENNNLGNVDREIYERTDEDNQTIESTFNNKDFIQIKQEINDDPDGSYGYENNNFDKNNPTNNNNSDPLDNNQNNLDEYNQNDTWSEPINNNNISNNNDEWNNNKNNNIEPFNDNKNTTSNNINNINNNKVRGTKNSRKSNKRNLINFNDGLSLDVTNMNFTNNPSSSPLSNSAASNNNNNNNNNPNNSNPNNPEYNNLMQDICDFVMSQSQKLNDKSRPQSRTCHICHATLSNPLSLKNHIQGTHLALKLRRCNLCGETFKWTMQLARHKKRVHANINSSNNNINSSNNNNNNSNDNNSNSAYLNVYNVN